MWAILAGGSIDPTEQTKVCLYGGYYAFEEEPGTEDELGWEVGVSGTYNYTEDLGFTLGYSHFFAEEKTLGKDDADYVYFQTQLCF